MISIVSGLLTLLTSAHAALTYVPENLDYRSANILVVLHGCVQTPEAMALGSGFDLEAAKSNFVVIYPKAPEGSHPLDCWSWFKPENQRADSGQLRSIMDQVQSVRLTLGLINSKLFAVGFSAGASTVSSLLACYPNDFAAGIVHSGTGYAMAGTQAQGLSLMKDNSEMEYPMIPGAPCRPTDFKGRLLVVQGGLDQTVRPSNAERVIHQFVPEATTPPIGKGWRNRRPYTESLYHVDGVTRAKLVKVWGLTHAWSGSIDNRRKVDVVAQIPFFSRSGPSATDLSWNFIKESLGVLTNP